MKPFVDRQRKYMEAQKAAREERAAEERKFMTILLFDKNLIFNYKWHIHG